MIIGFDAKRAFLNFSGLGNYSRSTILMLNEYFPEHTYYLYTPSINKNHEIYSFGKGIDNLHLKLPVTKNKMLSAYWRSFRLGKTAEQDKVDIFHGLSSELPKDIIKTNIKSFVTIHDLIFIRYPELYKRIDRLVYRKKCLFAAQSAYKVIAVSEQTKNDIVEFLNIRPEKIEVVYQGCNPRFYQKADNETKKKAKELFHLPDEYMLSVGTIEKRKNLLSVVKAMHRKPPGVPLVAIGRGTDYMIEMKKFIAARNLENDVIFLNNVPDKFLPAMYQMASLFIYPSVFEGFGIPILEALNSGVPVITTQGGCFSEPGGKHSCYIDPDNIDAIAEAIDKVLNDNELQNKMITAGYKHALKFREENLSKRLMEVYSM